MKPIAYRKLFSSKTNNAHLVTFDDGNDYVLKLYKKNEEKTLINEWFSFCIARFLRIPIPYSYLVEIPKEFIENVPNKENFKHASKQLANKYIENCQNAQEVNVTNISNHYDLAKIIVFDYWLYNTDRTRKNVLLEERSPGSHFLWIIDNAEIIGSYSWTINDLDYLPTSLMRSATHEMMARFIKDEAEFKAAVELIQTIPLQLLEEILTFIPEDWNLTEAERKAFIRTLHYRRHMILPKLVGRFVKRVYKPLKKDGKIIK